MFYSKIMHCCEELTHQSRAGKKPKDSPPESQSPAAEGRSRHAAALCLPLESSQAPHAWPRT